ncbi:MAG: hypothetical protein IJG81_06360 [Muribaculaceae bacterium]|nr:hypothetical protein [Muribaculaceae bacterium]
MRRGKKICETLKAIRHDIAVANEIDYQPTECKHEGDCTGTCPKCESETRWLERQLRARQALGKAVTIAGLSVALTAMSSCDLISSYKRYKDDHTLGEVPMIDSSYCTNPDSTTILSNSNDSASLNNRFTPMSKIDSLAKDGEGDDEEEQLMGEVAVDENGNIGDL